MTGYITNRAKRSWQAYCIYVLLLEKMRDIKHQLDKNPRHRTKHLEIKNFDNGRERGYTILDWNHETEISWAEFRGSDDIVVYPFKWDESIIDSEEFDFKTKTKYFKPQQFREVLNFILNHLDIDITERC